MANTKSNSKRTLTKKGVSKKKINNKLITKNKTSSRKVLEVLAVIIFSFTIIYLTYHLFVEKSCIKINMSTDKKSEYIILEGEKELISTQKYVSDLGYSMRYDINKFNVFKYKEQDIYNFLYNNEVLVIVEKSNLPASCSVSLTEMGYNNCYIKQNKETDVYYISTNGKTYKITVKSPSSTEYEEGVKARISYMINSFKIN